MDLEVVEVSSEDIQVDPGKRITIFVEIAPKGLVELTIDEKTAMVMVRGFIRGQYALIHWNDE